LQAGEEPVSSPLSSPALLGSGKEEEQKIIPKRQKVQAVLKSIKQSPKKVNLVAALVRGMRVEDALMQLQVTVKRASQTVYRVISEIRVQKQITFRVSGLLSSRGI
jgi:large subunit ribosomal protein L22